MKRRWLAGPYIVWMVLFTVLPMALLAYYAVTNAPADSGFTLKHFAMLRDPIYFKVLWRSILMAAGCTVICLVVAYPVAWLLSRRKNAGLLAVLFVLPMWMNFLLRTYAWMSLLENTGLINRLLQWIGFGQVTLLYNPGAVIVGMVYNFLPFMVLPIYTTLQKLDYSLVEAARDLGANSFKVFTNVVLPLSVPGIVSGITMVFMPAVTTFAIARLLGGSQFMLYGDLIEQQILQTGNWNFGAVLSFVMMIIMLVSMWIMNRFNKDEEGRALL